MELYPSIPHDLGLEILRKALYNGDYVDICIEDLIDMATFALKSNFFEFNGKVKQQISSTGIGSKFAPACACMFMAEIESQFLKTQKDQPLVWFMYIDDVFFIWTHDEHKLEMFLQDLNSFNSNIKFTHQSSKKSISFLDLMFSLLEDELTTDLYIKPTDRHQYLHFTSAYPDHTKRSIIYIQALRINRICSYERDFEKHLKEMKTWFYKRGYPNGIVENETKKVKFSNKVLVRKTKTMKKVWLLY